MTDRLSDLDPFTVHDPGCHCWPHVSESALSEAVIAGAVDEYRASKATIATLRAALPLDWCGHNEQIWDLTKALDDAEATIATLRAELEAWRHPDVAPSTPLALELATLRAIEKAARAACDNAYRDRADPETMDALRAALGED